ncbi:MAG: hypothetical protein P8104_03730 [Gammaproteobacteria bacterium]
MMIQFTVSSVQKKIALLVASLALTACQSLDLESNKPVGQSGQPGDKYGKHEKMVPEKMPMLPYTINFRADGEPEIIAGPGARIVDMDPAKDFPIPAKLRKVSTVSFVTYEGSCEVLLLIGSGYKKIIIEDDNVCAAIQP